MFIGKNKKHPVFDKHIVLIFDECHRSQFGEMHRAITKAFKKYHLFGFTGTPIFAVNAGSGGNPLMRTTEQAFGDKLHTYTIVDAINDGNVLPFRIDYCDTVKMSPDVQDKQVRAIDVERALAAPERYARLFAIHWNISTRKRSATNSTRITASTWRGSMRSSLQHPFQWR